MRITIHPTTMTAVIAGGALALSSVTPSLAQDGDVPSCADLAQLFNESLHTVLETTLTNVVGDENAGLGNEMWGTIVDRDGIVCAVAFTGEDRGDQWPGSRVISAQKANTANAFSLPSDANADGFNGALSSGNLYGQTIPQGSLFGLQFSNPVDTAVAYGDDPGDHKGADAEEYGTENDPMVGQMIGGVNVFGGGLALYEEVDGNGVKKVLGGLGVSGDTSCTDHIIAWKVRDAFELDFVPGGVSDTGDDNLIIVDPPTPNTFEHPNCGDLGEVGIIADLPDDFPIGLNP